MSAVTIEIKSVLRDPTKPHDRAGYLASVEAQLAGAAIDPQRWQTSTRGPDTTQHPFMVTFLVGRWRYHDGEKSVDFDAGSGQGHFLWVAHASQLSPVGDGPHLVSGFAAT